VTAKPQKCTGCGREALDFAQPDGGDLICSLCVEDALQERITELRRALRTMSAEEGRLQARLAHEQTTLAEIERVCIECGYDPESGLTVAAWLAVQLAHVPTCGDWVCCDCLDCENRRRAEASHNG
jgi:hypothetical protein